MHCRTRTPLLLACGVQAVSLTMAEDSPTEAYLKKHKVTSTIEVGIKGLESKPENPFRALVTSVPPPPFTPSPA